MHGINFDHRQYIGEYNEMSGILTVTNVYTDKTVQRKYANKYSAKRGFERIVAKMIRVEYND